jgi:hypothetical protein
VSGISQPRCPLNDQSFRPVSVLFILLHGKGPLGSETKPTPGTNRPSTSERQPVKCAMYHVQRAELYT